MSKAYEFNPSIISAYYPNVISIAWETKKVSRDVLSQGAKNSLGGILTVFRIDDWGNELQGLLDGSVLVSPSPIDNAPSTTIDNEAFIQQALTMVEDVVDKLDPWHMQDLVGDLLEAMGYKVNISPKGPDRV